MDTANLAKCLTKSRFYGAKSETIRSVTALAEAPVSDLGTLTIAEISHTGGTDLYQLLLDAHSADVLGTPEAARELGAALARGESAGFGSLHTVTDGPVLDPSDVAGGAPISGEQSNTSLKYAGEHPVIVKFFRKLAPGVNPDVELLAGLTKAGCRHVAPLRAWNTVELGGQEYVTAMAQDFAAGAKDGWEYALTFAEGGSRQGSFAGEAAHLGEAVAAVHRDLAEQFGTQVRHGAEVADALVERLDGLVARAGVISEFAEAARERYDALRGIDVPVQRIHGDLHLGQVLRTQDRYLLIDFEGEPARPLADRRKPDSALRDVAGVLRSLDYARVDGAEAFEEAYRSFFGATEFTPEQRALLDAYVLDKALYEVVYETTYRPDWVEIPLAAVRRLAQ